MTQEIFRSYEGTRIYGSFHEYLGILMGTGAAFYFVNGNKTLASLAAAGGLVSFLVGREINSHANQEILEQTLKPNNLEKMSNSPENSSIPSPTQTPQHK